MKDKKDKKGGSIRKRGARFPDICEYLEFQGSFKELSAILDLAGIDRNEVAKKARVTYVYVGNVIMGIRRSNSVNEAIKEILEKTVSKENIKNYFEKAMSLIEEMK